MTNHVLSHDARWQNVLFYKGCCEYAAVRSNAKGSKGTKGIREGRKVRDGDTKVVDGFFSLI
jgi:hypothetical protein